MSHHSELRKKVLKDFAARSLNGTWGQPCSFLIILLTTEYRVRVPAFAWGGSILLAAITVARLYLLLRFDRLYSRHPQRWTRVTTGLFFLSALFWSFNACVAVANFDSRNWDTLIMLLAHAGIGLGTVNLMVHDVRQMRAALAILYAPLLITQAVIVSEWWHGPLLITTAYALYLVLQGGRFSKAYWQQVNDNHDLSTAARRDFLTRLPNRLGMEELLAVAVAGASRNGTLVAFLYIDLDGFKEVNDRYSHRVGDSLLREFAARLTMGAEPGGIAARLGGDEFAILISDCQSTETAAQVATRVMDLTRDPIQIDGDLLTCSASIGIGIFPQDADSADHLVRAADLAMYIAKNSGKGQVCLFDTLQPRVRTAHA